MAVRSASWCKLLIGSNMQDFIYHNPTKVIFGRHSVEQCGAEMAALGRHALVVFGRDSARRSGLIDRVTHLLSKSGVEFTLFGNISPNPSVDRVREGIELARKNGVDVLLGIGGGSVIDSAKAVAAGVVAPHDVWKFPAGKKPLKSALPIVALSTIAGSGSEMNSGMVLTDRDRGLKLGYGHRLLHPRVALLDPTMTFSVSPLYTAYGAIDALTHLFEFYLTHQELNSVIQEGYMESLARAIVVSLDDALRDPEGYGPRATLLWASGLALNGLSVAGLGKVGFPMHMLEHALSARFDVTHGAGLAAILPGWLKVHSSSHGQRIITFIEHVFARRFDHDGAEQSAIAHLERWLKRIGAPTTLAELGIHRDDLDHLSESALHQAKVWRLRDYDLQRIGEIYGACTPLDS